jgi:hypothetical protein
MTGPDAIDGLLQLCRSRSGPQDPAERISPEFPGERLVARRDPGTGDLPRTRCWPRTIRSRGETLAALAAAHRPRLLRGLAAPRCGADLPVYFVKAHSRLAKTGENTNCFIRKYIPKGIEIHVSLEYR